MDGSVFSIYFFEEVTLSDVKTLFLKLLVLIHPRTQMNLRTGDIVPSPAMAIFEMDSSSPFPMKVPDHGGTSVAFPFVLI